MNKKEFLEEAKAILYEDFADCIKTDVDDELYELSREDYDAYERARNIANIIKIDHDVLLWINGILLAWNSIYHNKEDQLTQDDIIPNFYEVFERSRIFAMGNGCIMYGERCRLWGPA